MITWKTYDWSQHDAKHYDMTEHVSHCYAPMIVSYDPNDNGSEDSVKFALIKTSDDDTWELPVGSHLCDGEKPIDAIMRSMHRMFAEHTLAELTGNSASIGDTNLFTVSDNDTGYTSYTMFWSEASLNNHIKLCVEAGDRPRWCAPGNVEMRTHYHAINVYGYVDQLISARLINGYVQDMQFFTRRELQSMIGNSQTYDLICGNQKVDVERETETETETMVNTVIPFIVLIYAVAITMYFLA
jgi:hypothetical protein